MSEGNNPGAAAYADASHKNLQSSSESLLNYRLAGQQSEMERKQGAFNNFLSISDRLQQQRDAMFNKSMMQRQQGLTEKESALKRQAADFALRKQIEDESTRDGFIKNFTIGMMSSLGSMGVKK